MKLARLIRIFFGLLLIAFQTAHSADGDRKSDWPQGRLSIQTQLNGKCLDVPNGKFEAGTALQTWQCLTGNAAQVFEFTSERQIRIGGLCLNIFGGRGNNGDTVGLWPCVGAPNEKWDLFDGHLKGMNGRCLDVYGGNRENGARIIVWDCVGRAPNQLWTVAKPENQGDQGAAMPNSGSTKGDALLAPCPQCPPWVASSAVSNLLPLAAQAEVWSNPKPFNSATRQMTVQSRFMSQKGTTCNFEVQFNNPGPKHLDESIVISRPGKVAVGSNDNPLRARLAPGTSVAYATEVRECPLNWGETKDMNKCAACEPMVYFVAR